MKEIKNCSLIIGDEKTFIDADGIERVYKPCKLVIEDESFTIKFTNKQALDMYIRMIEKK